MSFTRGEEVLIREEWLVGPAGQTFTVEYWTSCPFEKQTHAIKNLLTAFMLRSAHKISAISMIKYHPSDECHQFD